MWVTMYQTFWYMSGTRRTTNPATNSRTQSE